MSVLKSSITIFPDQEENISKLMDYARQLRVGNILGIYLQMKL